MTLTDILITIQQREIGTSLADNLIADMHELAETYQIDSDPQWLHPISEAVEQGREVFLPVFFERENSDIYSYLVEMAQLLKWSVAFEGECDLIEFPKLGWRIYISNES